MELRHRMRVTVPWLVSPASQAAVAWGLYADIAALGFFFFSLDFTSRVEPPVLFYLLYGPGLRLLIWLSSKQYSDKMKAEAVYLVYVQASTLSSLVWLAVSLFVTLQGPLFFGAWAFMGLALLLWLLQQGLGLSLWRSWLWITLALFGLSLVIMWLTSKPIY